MTVGIVGSGPAAGAVEQALEDVGVETTEERVETFGETELTVVIGQVGETVFERANEQALATGTRWLAVELGGVGGIPIVDAAVAGFDPKTSCYECLSGRVNANLDPQADPAAAPSPHTTRFAGAVAGREAARYVTGDADIFGRVVVVPFTEREFLPLPNCACDSGQSGTLDREYVNRTVEESLARAERALDDQFGIVQEVGEAESFPVPYYLARTSDTSGFSDVSAARDAAGVAPDWNSAFMKALGEGMERYCAGIYHTDAFKRARPSNIGTAVPPSAFVCQTDPQNEEIPWTTGENLHTDGAVAIPAEFVYYPPPEKRYRPAITTGLGFGNSSVEAILSGLYEVLERDATMLAWHSTFDPLELVVEDETYEQLCRRADSEGLDVTAVLLTQDVDVPVVAVAVEGEEWPKIAFGSDADLDVVSAATSALCEALQNWMELRGMGPEQAQNAMGKIGAYAASPGEAAEFVNPETQVPAESVGSEEIPKGTAELDAVLDRVADAGLTAYASRTTTRDVDQLGFEAVRVVVPQAQPLCFGQPYFGDRAKSVPEDLGFKPLLGRAHHPFP